MTSPRGVLIGKSILSVYNFIMSNIVALTLCLTLIAVAYAQVNVIATAEKPCWGKDCLFKADGKAD